MVSMLEKIKSVLMTPDKFFASITKEKGYGEPLKYLAATSLVGTIGSIIVLNAAINLAPSNPIYQTLSGSLGIAMYALFWGLGIILSFATVAVMHVFVYLFGGRNGYMQSYKAAIYGQTAGNLIGWIPYIGILANLYSVYLTIKGISLLQNMSMGRAVAVIVVPILVIVVLAFVLVGAAVLAILGARA